MKNLAPRTSQAATGLPSRLKIKTHVLVLASACMLVMCAAHPLMAQEGQSREEPVAEDSGSTGARKITGRVVSDDGKPLAGVAIFLYRVYAPVPGPPQTTSTNAEGNFQSSALAPGLYSVSATLPGFALSQPDLNESGDQKYYRPGDSVSLTLVKGGVVTGVLRDAAGEPMVAVLVRAVRVRDANGRRSTRPGSFARDRMTDDRGVYRLYGLEPGTYIISAGGGSRAYGGYNNYGGDVSTYFPSATRDTAAEVVVRHGEEVTGIDIRYRGERGRTISGTISGAYDAEARRGISVILRQAITAGFTDQTFIPPASKPAFSFEGVADGEYELIAQQGGGTGEVIASTPRRVIVKGADVAGLELTLAQLASISGRAVLEPAPKVACGDEPLATLPEAMINIRRDEKGQPKNSSGLSLFSAGGTLPDEQGDFTIRNLAAGSYRLNLRLPNDFWYARSISLPGAPRSSPRPPATTTKPAQTKGALAAQSSVITLKSGERLTGTLIQLAQEGATMRGKITPTAEGASVPDNLKVYLIPQEREGAEDILRFSETNVMSDGAFLIRNLAPGRYLIIARLAPENETHDSVRRPLFWDEDSRARLRREAEAINVAIELKPCQRISDYELHYPAAK